MGEFGIGQSANRIEDARLLTGGGRYIDDVNLPGQLRAVILRSPHSHAEIRRIDAAAALALPGVAGVFTAADLLADGLGTTAPTLPRKRADGSPMVWEAHYGLAIGRVRYVGDPVALIVAETVDLAQEAAELVEVDYAPLPAVTAAAAAPGAPVIWPAAPDNISFVWEGGDKAATDAAFARAAHRVRRRYPISRVQAHYMEPRGALGAFEPKNGRFTLYSDVQFPHRLRNVLASQIFKLPEHQIRVVAGDIGGGFGGKGWQYPEHRLMLWAARRLGRPVKWLCERSEVALADDHARDIVAEAELALDAEGNFLGFRLANTCNLGAYVSSDRSLISTYLSLPGVTGVYRTPAAHATVRGVFSNTGPTAPYRGAGRPEATYIMERLIDEAARELGFDRIELRRRNLIPPSALPYRNPLGFNYDSGDFGRGMEQAMALADLAGYPARLALSAARGRLRGLGVINAIERAASPTLEYAELRFDPSGGATLLMGTKNQGQGHETVFRQILNERLGLPPGAVRFVEGDTDQVAFGTGSMGSRSIAIGGSALVMAADKVIEKGRKIAAHLMEASPEDIDFADGRFTITGTDRSLPLQQVARLAFQPDKLPRGMEPGLYETGTFIPTQDTFPNGTHVVELEIDPETGAVELLRYVVVDDVGTVINPKTLKGQIHGGVVQGLGQVLMEEIAYDPETGQLLSGSFMDYAMPRAGDLCAFEVASNPVPTRLNPLGAKGAGEAGTVGALPAVINALLDALAPLGVRDLAMPATSARIWQAIAAARAAAPPS